MQADKYNENIKDLLGDFDTSFGKGDWNAIEAQVLENNNTFFKAKRRKTVLYSIGAIATSLILGMAVYLPNFTSSAQQTESIPEKAKPAKQENQTEHSPEINTASFASNNTETKNQIQAEKETTNKTERPPSVKPNKQTPIVKANSKKQILPKTLFDLTKTTYCKGEHLSYTTNGKQLNIEVNNKTYSLKELEHYKFRNGGDYTIKVKQNNRTLNTFNIVVNTVKAKLTFKKNYDPENPVVHFKNEHSRSGKQTWYIDNKFASDQANFDHAFPSKGKYRVKLVTTSENGCKDSSEKTVRILRAYNLMATTVFNPKKGSWLPMGLKKKNIAFELKIVNQDGATIFKTSDPSHAWNGQINENQFAENGDLFFWVAKVKDLENGHVNEYGNSLLVSFIAN